MINSFAYSLDPTGRRTQISENTGRVTTYHYDNLYRLLSESIQDAANGNHQASYQYDRVGNRTQQSINCATTTFAYDNNDRILQMGGTTYSYDANGNTLNETTQGITTHYTFDAKNKLATVQKNGITTLFNYNADGIRTSQTTGNNTTKYVVDHNQPHAQVLLEITSTPAANDETTTYTYGDDLLSQRKNNVTSFFHYDGLGSTRALTNDAGNATDKWNYEAFGNTINREGTTENKYLFTGEQFDKNLNQYYLRARYYNPANGRFTQQDTWMGRNREPITLNKYLYAHSEPTNGSDPTGMFFNLSGTSSAQNISLILRSSQISTINVARYGFAVNQSTVAGGTIVSTSSSSSSKIALLLVASASVQKASNIKENSSNPASGTNVSENDGKDQSKSCSKHGLYGPYYRYETKIEYFLQALTTFTLYGNTPRDSFGPAVQAYINRHPGKSFELRFCTPVKGEHSYPWVYWRQGQPGVINHTDDTVKIPIVLIP